mmetsp:Transcript_48932/g.105977  ORF Transcript_48932/g.105977 Transcript_48932/m.105977 type:complete len:250 (-) Transcript_48932:903-1652(-)
MKPSSTTARVLLSWLKPTHVKQSVSTFIRAFAKAVSDGVLQHSFECPNKTAECSVMSACRSVPKQCKMQLQPPLKICARTPFHCSLSVISRGLIPSAVDVYMHVYRMSFKSNQSSPAMLCKASSRAWACSHGEGAGCLSYESALQQARQRCFDSEARRTRRPRNSIPGSDAVCACGICCPLAEFAASAISASRSALHAFGRNPCHPQEIARGHGELQRLRPLRLSEPSTCALYGCTTCSCAACAPCGPS